MRKGEATNGRRPLNGVDGAVFGFQETRASIEALGAEVIVAVEHRIGRLVQLGIRQAKYFGKAKTGFQIALAATVANLMLVAAVSGAASSAALALALLVGIASLPLHGLTAQKGLLQEAPSRPGF